MKEQTMLDLINDGWMKLPDQFNNLIVACLNHLENEMERCFWNQNQKDFNSPFQNTGADPIDVGKFVVRAYDWNTEEDGDRLPNFDSDDIKIFWYKHSRRDVEAFTKDREIVLKLPNLLNEYIEAIKQFYKESELLEDNEDNGEDSEKKICARFFFQNYDISSDGKPFWVNLNKSDRFDYKETDIPMMDEHLADVLSQMGEPHYVTDTGTVAEIIDGKAVDVCRTICMTEKEFEQIKDMTDFTQSMQKLGR